MQDFYEQEHEGNFTEHLSYSCPACNDTGIVIGFDGRGRPCKYCKKEQPAPTEGKGERG